MKTKFTSVAILALFFAFIHQGNAQVTLLNDLLQQLNSNLLNGNAPPSLDQGSLDELGAGYDSLAQNISGLGFSAANQDTLLGTIGWLYGSLVGNANDLNGLYGQYQDSLSFGDAANWNVTIIGGDSLVNQGLNNLEDPYSEIGDPANPELPSDFGPALGQLFDVNLFPDIELAFGSQSADLSYWGLNYHRNAKIVRVGSVPRFNKSSNGALNAMPIEARWHGEVSWISSDPVGVADINSNVNNEGAFNPLLLYGDYALMATPSIGSLGRISFRLLTSLGTEFGTYAPAHKEFAPSRTHTNKGFTTGVGAQTGAGFAFTSGQLTVYTMATFTHGKTFGTDESYEYDSGRYEVGARFGNIVNLRYSNGTSSWEPNGNRIASVKNQFTLGIILPELHF